MKKRYVAGLAAGLLVLGMAWGAGATLTTIGTASYDDGAGARSYNLIYDNDSPFGPITWLDYTSPDNTWGNQLSWAAGLNTAGVLTYSLNPGYTANWSRTSWRLPNTVDGFYWNLSYDGTTTAGYNITTSEMGHLYYTELGNKGFQALDGTYPQPGWGLANKGPFNNLLAYYYWSGTHYGGGGGPYAWSFNTKDGLQDASGECLDGSYALAVRPGPVSLVPEPPATMLLMGTGLAGLAWARWRRCGR